MNTFKLLFAPDAAPSGGGASIPTIPLSNVATPPPLTARTALGLDSSPHDQLNALAQRQQTTQPRNTPYAPPPAVKPPEAPAAPALTPEPVVTPPAPDPVPAAPAAPVVEAPKKFKIAGKEYTEAELEAELAARNAPQPAQPAAPAPPQAPQYTPEQLAAQERAAEEKWLGEQVKSFEPYVNIKDEQWEEVLSGGAKGVAAAKSIFANSIAAAVMHSRKQMFRDFIEPGMKQVAQIAEHTQQLYAAQQQGVAQAAEARFFSTNPEYAEQADLCRRAAYAINEKFPDVFSRMSEAEQFTEVKRQVDLHLNQQFSAALGFKVENWREIRQRLAPVSQQPTAPTPAAPASATPPPAVAQRGPTAAPPIIGNMIQQSARTSPTSSAPAAPSTPPSVFAPGGGASPAGTAPQWSTQVNADMRR